MTPLFLTFNPPLLKFNPPLVYNHLIAVNRVGQKSLKMAFSDSTMSENSFLFTSESVGEVSTEIPSKIEIKREEITEMEFYYPLIA